jgi:hypothetical protein
VAEARADLRKAERRCERADDSLAALRCEYDHERLKLWGANPDVSALLDVDCSSVLYEAARALAEAYGMGFGMRWADIDQHVLHLLINRGEDGALERAEAAVRFFAPHVVAKRGWRRFGVQHRESGEFGLELRYSSSRGTARLVRMHYGVQDSQIAFKSLADALRHIQEHHWIEDIYELELGTALLEFAQ